MQKKRSKKKLIPGIVVAVLLVLAIALAWGGNYLVSFAIGRDTGTVNVAPESTLSEETTQSIMENWQDQADDSETWLSQSAVEKVQIVSSDGLKLSGEAVIATPSSHRWVIAVHGYRSRHGHMFVFASQYGLRGYNVLLPDLRGCGESEGDYIGMGWPDRLDLLKWADWIIERDSQAQIVLHGISMGAAAVMMAAGEELPEQVKVIVEDCGYTSVWDIFEDELAYLFHLPSFPVLHIASQIAFWRSGYNFTQADSVKQIARAKVPVLFIHGSEDNFVHTDMVYRVYEACPAEKQLLVVEGAGHGNSYNHSPELYFDTVFRFIGKYAGE